MRWSSLTFNQITLCPLYHIMESKPYSEGLHCTMQNECVMKLWVWSCLWWQSGARGVLWWVLALHLGKSWQPVAVPTVREPQCSSLAVLELCCKCVKKYHLQKRCYVELVANTTSRPDVTHTVPATCLGMCSCRSPAGMRGRQWWVPQPTSSLNSSNHELPDETSFLQTTLILCLKKSFSPRLRNRVWIALQITWNKSSKLFSR